MDKSYGKNGLVGDSLVLVARKMDTKIIPVIDLKNGCVVHAKYGQRENYQPIKSVLTSKVDIYSVLEGFLQLYDFDTFYIADLNAITGQGNNTDLISRVLNDFSKITFWVDAGYQKAGVFPVNYFPVLGSECFTDENFFELVDFEKKFVLSLDFDSSGKKLGAEKIFTHNDFWSENVILMTLNRVGSLRGVEIDLLAQFKRNYSQTNFIAAGGIRDKNDIEALKTLDIKYVLVASALHSGAITAVEIAGF